MRSIRTESQEGAAMKCVLKNIVMQAGNLYHYISVSGGLH